MGSSDEIKVERGGEFALAVDGKNGAELADKVAAERPGAVLLATTGTANTAFVHAFRAKAQGVPLAVCLAARSVWNPRTTAMWPLAR